MCVSGCAEKAKCIGTWLKGSNMSTRSRVATCALSAIVLIGYVCLGSLLFNLVENKNGEGETNEKTKIIEKLKKNVDLLRNFTNASIAFDDAEYIRLLDETYNTTIELFQAEQLSYLPWNFFTGIHFCLTAITTIGYGYITPATQLGRGLCILYVVIGIPINLLFSAKLAYFIAKWITQLYVLLEKFTRRLVCKNRCKNNLTPKIIDKIDEAGEFSQGVDIQEDLRGTNGSIQYINGSFSTSDETLSPRSEVGILGEQPRIGHRNGTNLVSNILPSIKDTANTSKDTLREAQQSNDEKTLIPLWFMFVLLVAFCSLVSAIMYREEHDNWSFLDAFYYVIITFTTVGFGDLHYKSSRDIKDFGILWWKMLYTYVLMEIGLAIMAAFITLWADRFQQGVKKARTTFHAKHAFRSSTGICHSPACYLHGKLSKSNGQGGLAKETDQIEGTNL